MTGPSKPYGCTRPRFANASSVFNRCEMHARIGQMTGVRGENVIELERPEVGFRSRQWMMISLVAGFLQTLNLIATVSTQCVESRQSLAFLLIPQGPGGAISSWCSPNESDRKFVSIITVATNRALKEVRCEVHNGEFPC